MSVTIGGRVQSSANLLSKYLALPEVYTARVQNALKAAEEAGRRSLDDHTPVDEGYLLDTAESHRNQYAVWFSVKVNPRGSQMGGEHDYGFYMEFGYHDRGGNWHDGHWMVHGAAQTAESVFVAMMGIAGAQLSSRAQFAGLPTTGAFPGGF